jgi:hypothetical protein
MTGLESTPKLLKVFESSVKLLEKYAKFWSTFKYFE